MACIEEGRFFTVMAVFEVDPKQQQELINGIADQVEKHMKNIPGFVSANFHGSNDGRKVVNYAQWLSKEAWQEAARVTNSDIAMEAISEVIKRCQAKSVTGKSFGYYVARVVEGE